MQPVLPGLPFVSVIIPHFDDLERLRLCHSQLLVQTYPRDRFEIVVADNNSRCGLDAVREVAATARVIPAELQGAGPARNAGVTASRGDVLAFLDSDCVPERAWLAEGVARLLHYDFVGGEVVTFAVCPKRPNAVEAFEIVFNFNFRRYIEKVGFTGTGNMFVWRRVFTRVGGFRPAVSEDMDWSFRARSLGYRLGYAERAVVGHPARRAWPELERRWARIINEHFSLARERRCGRVAFALKGAIMPASILPHAVRVLLSPRLTGARSRGGAIVVLSRLRLWRGARMLRVAAGLGPNKGG